jgi:alpha-D-xyloside xylohydrolase
VYHVFELEEGTVATACVPALDGGAGAAFETTVEVRRSGAQIEIAVLGASKPWSVLLRGIENVVSVTGGTAQANELGARVVPDAGVQAVVVHLEETQ